MDLPKGIKHNSLLRINFDSLNTRLVLLFLGLALIPLIIVGLLTVWAGRYLHARARVD